MGEVTPLPDEELARLSVAIRADLDARDDAAVSLSATYALHLIAELRALREAVAKPVTMSEVRLTAGEGTLLAHHALAAANAVWAARLRNLLPAKQPV